MDKELQHDGGATAENAYEESKYQHKVLFLYVAFAPHEKTQEGFLKSCCHSWLHAFACEHCHNGVKQYFDVDGQ